MNLRTTKNRLAKLPIVGGVLVRIWRKFRDPWFGSIGNSIATAVKKRNAIVVQIGANDGSRFDPVSELIKQRKGWRAVFVEPIPSFFEKLRSYYGDNPRFSFECVAIGEKCEQRQLFFLRAEARAACGAWKEYFDAVASFDKMHVLRALGDQRDQLEVFVDSIQVNVLTVAELMRRQNLATIDILVVDAEGYDWKIVKQVDFKKLRPRVILFEHSGLTAQERDEALSALAPFYDVTDMGIDYLCVSLPRRDPR